VAAADRNYELQTKSQLFIEFACPGLNNLWSAETQTSSFILFITHFSTPWTVHMGRRHHLKPLAMPLSSDYIISLICLWICSSLWWM